MDQMYFSNSDGLQFSHSEGSESDMTSDEGGTMGPVVGSVQAPAEAPLYVSPDSLYMRRQRGTANRTSLGTSVFSERTRRTWRQSCRLFDYVGAPSDSGGGA
jgi:hypothetical protein